MGNHVVHPLPLVKGTIEKSIYTFMVGGGETVESAYHIWYLEGPKKNIIVDAGTSASLMAAVGFPGRTDVQSPEDGLGKFGLKPADIDIVILTQLHHDHIGLARKYTKARFIVQKRELEQARHHHVIWAYMYWLQKEMDDLNYEIIDGDKKIVEGVRVVLTPGHTAGGQTVAIETAQGLAAITGFCCIRENFEPSDEVRTKKRWPDIIPPAIHYDVREAYDSILKVKRMAQVIYPLHSAEFIGK